MNLHKQLTCENYSDLHCLIGIFCRMLKFVLEFLRTISKSYLRVASVLLIQYGHCVKYLGEDYLKNTPTAPGCLNPKQL